MTVLTDAAAFAALAHAGQTRKGRSRAPYISHPERVAAFVEQHGGTPEMIAAAWLHDTVEDCGIRPEDLRDRFGPAIAALVAELTDDKSLPKHRRKELQVLHAPGKSAGAGLIKIGDKTANVTDLTDDPPADWPTARRRAYLDWAAAVVDALPAGWPSARAAFATALARGRAAPD